MGGQVWGVSSLRPHEARISLDLEEDRIQRPGCHRGVNFCLGHAGFVKRFFSPCAKYGQFFDMAKTHRVHAENYAMELQKHFFFKKLFFSYFG